MKHGKRYNLAVKKIQRSEYTIADGVKLLKETATAKYDESVDIAVRLGVDPRHADQVVRGVVTLPHGLGKSVRVLALVRADKEEEAKSAGADYVGFDEFIEKIKGGWLDFDVLVATPDVMGELGKLGRVLGPRGLMPNPKSGTVTPNIGDSVKEIKAGKIDFRCDKYGIVHTSVGKASFPEDKLVDNLNAFIQTIIKLKPSAAKGTYLKSISISSTHGPGIRLATNVMNYAE
ncbi:MAG: 50S ribosomal protein L1 [Calditrichaeota bacterium]|nr:50S ribosomal protein L1 [Calditrichota bacterium]